jgi:hypothetical protein
MPQNLPIVILSVAAAALVALGLWIVLLRRESPRERERRRRLAVNVRGRLADGNITEATASSIFYSYSVGGVEYATSQDIDELREVLKVEPERLIGCPVTVKYAMRNPANSIVVCEEWSGLRSSVR